MKKTILILIPLLIMSGLFLSCSREEPALTGPPPPTILPVKVNELYTRGILANPDWIEIFNPNSSAIDLSGYKLYNLAGKNGTVSKLSLPSGTSINASGYIVVVVNDTTLTNRFDLSTTGETVWLENGGGTIIDSVVIPALGVDSSYARKPDGSSTWVIVTPPTKGEANSILPIVMNEIFSRGVAPDLDFIEMYNPNTTSVDISGYKIYDIGGQSGTKPKKAFPSGTIIPAKGFFAIITDTTDASGFGLSSGGESVWLENANGNIIDNVAFPAMPVATTSYCRIPDGSATWQISNTITKGLSNLP
jgi:predicted extracellular nuclease